MANRTQRRAATRKKASPRSVPVTRQDVERAKRVATDETMDTCIAIILSALLDSGLLKKEQIPEAQKSIDYLSDSVIKGYVSVSDLKHALLKEQEIIIT